VVGFVELVGAVAVAEDVVVDVAGPVRGRADAHGVEVERSEGVGSVGEDEVEGKLSAGR
jgi:hypothetical protein